MESKNFSVSVVIPNYNGKELLEKNLPAVLAAKEYSGNQIVEVIIVDDGSTDGSVNLIKSKFPEVKLIRHKINRGFSSSANTSVRGSKGNLILLLNTDVVPEKNFLTPAISLFEDPKVFAVSLHEKGYGWGKGYFSGGYLELAKGEESGSTHSSFYVSGGSGVFRRKLWIELGGMDEKLLSPFYWEDVDICYRAEKRGYINLWEPKSLVVHNHESTINKFPKSYTQNIRERNQLLVIWKNIGSGSLIRKHIAGLLSRIVKHPGYIRIVFMALMRIGIVLKGRKHEIRASRVSDEAVLSRFEQK